MGIYRRDRSIALKLARYLSKEDMFNDKRVGSLPLGGILAALGSFLSLLMLGAFYTFGNIMPYMVSYMRNATGEDITYRSK